MFQNVKIVSDAIFLYMNPVALLVPELLFWEYPSELVLIPQLYPAICVLDSSEF
jgi:hypothetical protein